MPTILFSAPGIIALKLFFKKNNWKRNFFYFFSVYNLIVNIFLFFFLLISCFLGIVIYKDFLSIENVGLFFIIFIILFILFILTEFWFFYIAKKFFKEIIFFRNEKEKDIEENRDIENIENKSAIQKKNSSLK